MDLPERYVWLCLRLDRHVEGFVDAYVGPSAWSAAAASEDPVEPAALLDEARELIGALDASGLDPDRRRWLRGQLEAIVCIAERLTGAETAWTEEVERCLGTAPTRTPTDTLEAIHRRLEAALPGPGSLRDRYLAWDERNAVPRGTIVPALERLNDVLRPRAHELAPMPDDEDVTYELVGGVPYIAFNRYEGGSHSRIEVNADLPVSVVLLAAIAAHETYPGHHTERTAKDAHLTRELSRVETSVSVASTPEALMTEGVAQLALEAALGPEPFRQVAEILEGLDVRFDPDEAHEVHLAEVAFYAVAVNAAFMLHEDGAPEREVADYLRTWALESEERAERTVAFVADPEARAYVPAYPEGLRLCSAFADRDPRNHTRLLTEQLTTAGLLALDP
jgi:hypothetical protein